MMFSKCKKETSKIQKQTSATKEQNQKDLNKEKRDNFYNRLVDESMRVQGRTQDEMDYDLEQIVWQELKDNK